MPADIVQWYYETDGEKHGPCPAERLRALIAGGQIESSNLLWRKGFDNWIQASSTEEFADAFISHEPPPLPKELSTTTQYTASQNVPVSLWARFWARIIDAVLFGVVIGVPLSLLVGYAFPDFSLRFLREAQSAASLIIAVWVTPLWLALDALMLARWGTTPGKWVAGIVVCDHEGNPPSLKASVARSFHIWWRAYGLALPLVSMVTLATAYAQSKRAGGVAPWDKKLGLEVRAAIPRVRTVTAAVIAIVVFSIVTIVDKETQKTRQKMVNTKTMPEEVDWSQFSPVKPEAAKAPGGWVDLDLNASVPAGDTAQGNGQPGSFWEEYDAEQKRRLNKYLQGGTDAEKAARFGLRLQEYQRRDERSKVLCITGSFHDFGCMADVIAGVRR